MVICELCNKEFPFPWKLKRHLARKKPCTTTANIPNDTTDIPNDTTDIPNDTIYIPNDTTDIPNDTTDIPNDTIYIPNDTTDIPNDTNSIPNDTRCEYCYKLFSTQSNKIKHAKKCKMKNDEIRMLEKQCKVEHKIQSIGLECTYCNKKYSRTGSLTRHRTTCKMRKVYKLFLKDKIVNETQTANTINNNNTTNNTTNNTQNADVIVNIGAVGNDNLNSTALNNIQSVIQKAIKYHCADKTISTI